MRRSSLACLLALTLTVAGVRLASSGALPDDPVPHDSLSHDSVPRDPVPHDSAAHDLGSPDPRSRDPGAHEAADRRHQEARPATNAGAARAADAATSKVTEVAQLQFHSAFWINVHHTLYAAAWARRPPGPRRPMAGTLPAPLTAPFSADERAAWEAAIDYYDRELASRSLLFDGGMTSLKRALVAEDLGAAAVAPDLRAVLERAAPVYRRHFWPAHDRANRAWIAATASGVRTIAPDTTALLARLYDYAWFTTPVRIDVVWVGDRTGAYTTDDPTHATMSIGPGSIGPGSIGEASIGEASIGDRSPGERSTAAGSTAAGPAGRASPGKASIGDAQPARWTDVEMVFHEMSHALIVPTERLLEQALGDRLREHADLWHVIQFYVTGAAVQQVLRARGVDYTPYLYSTGLFDRAWSRYRTAVETHWEPYVRGAITRAQAIERTVAAVTTPLAAASDVPVAEVANLRFHSAFWINLHHTLYGAAWARRPVEGTGRRPVDPLPAPLTAPLTAPFSDDERAAWDAAVDYYARQVADRDLRSGQGMTAIKQALASGDPGAAAVGAELRAVLERAAPVYRRHFWPAHDRVNREWIASTTGDLRTIASEAIASHERLYGVTWFASPVRVDIVWVGRAYTTLDPTHATISTAEAALTGWSRVEIVFHEVSHALIVPIEQALGAALGPHLAQHGGLWHVIQFYVTGRAVQQALRARGIDYTPYLYSTGLFDRAWSHYRKAIEDNWEPYVRGTLTRDQAIERTVAAISRQAPPPR